MTFVKVLGKIFFAWTFSYRRIWQFFPNQFCSQLRKKLLNRCWSSLGFFENLANCCCGRTGLNFGNCFMLLSAKILLFCLTAFDLVLSVLPGILVFQATHCAFIREAGGNLGWVRNMWKSKKVTTNAILVRLIIQLSCGWQHWPDS